MRAAAPKNFEDYTDVNIARVLATANERDEAEARRKRGTFAAIAVRPALADSAR